MLRIAVLVPGIMGSILERSDYYGGTQTIWGENLTANYRTLINNPGVLKWADNPADARLMRFVNVDAEIPLADWRVPFRKLDIWGRVIQFLNARSDVETTVEFGYDWRGPLVDSANRLINWLKANGQVDLASERSDDAPPFLFITHSMGGLVVRIAIANGKIHHSWVDKIIHIGTPLKGSPSAFRTAYEGLSLPLFREIFGLVRRKNRAAFEHHLLDCIRTFPSLYHLLPPREVPYLYYSQSSRSNPLRERSMSNEHRSIASECHETLERAQEIIANQRIKVSTIYTEVHAGRQTELEYRVTPLADGRGYTVDGVHARSDYGDGTVPADSARGELPVRGLSVINVDHMVMCNNDKVVECLSVLI